ncbi:hypothetical protein MTo_00601 [Microcystis aeruginosa NIES-1211]|uniref:PEP-CTERM sorting domain-containing protein n=1 Tax=Microcystis TaxID=1125 RepID=UPI000D7C80B0|nr:PEP-CTERM sorting domain-containing protein [Microcystis aeruginosa]GBL13311.1 hypothetical protein MTo_00601 [Microcystis aeruginosa NIES-1211]
MKLAITHLVLSTATFGLMLAVPQNAQASGLIRNVAANVVTGGTGFGGIGLTTNGAGLIGPPVDRPTLTGDHSATSNTNSWRSANLNAGTIGQAVIEFTFPRVYNLAGFSFWNLGSTTTLASQGINGVKIEYLKENVWTPLIGAPISFLRGSTAGNTPVETFNFTPVFTTKVKFSNMTNHGGIGTNYRLGFNEIQFRSIPEPSTTLALLALGLAAVGLRKRI